MLACSQDASHDECIATECRQAVQISIAVMRLSYVDKDAWETLHTELCKRLTLFARFGARL